MRCNRFYVLAAICALALPAVARAESEAEYTMPGPAPAHGGTLGDRAAEQARTKALPAPRPAMFAPVAAASAKRLSAQQREERRFLKEAAASSRFEAEAARMALGKSSNSAVRSMAATLINHHAVAGNELLHMLHGRGMAAPMLSNDQRRVLNHLAKLQGARFDREFLGEVALKNQQQDVQSYEQASLMATEPRLQAWIARSLPTLRYHLATAERIAPAEAKLARGAVVPGNRLASRASMATRSMGSGPAPGAGLQAGGMQFGGDAQMGVSRSVAAWPSESSNR